jgi:hypothetical protein
MPEMPMLLQPPQRINLIESSQKAAEPFFNRTMIMPEYSVTNADQLLLSR